MNRTTFGLYARAMQRRLLALEAVSGLPAAAVAEIEAIHGLANGAGSRMSEHYGVTFASVLTPDATDPTNDDPLKSGGDDKE